MGSLGRAPPNFCAVGADGVGRQNGYPIARWNPKPSLNRGIL